MVFTRYSGLIGLASLNHLKSISDKVHVARKILSLAIISKWLYHSKGPANSVELRFRSCDAVINILYSVSIDLTGVSP